MPTKFDHVRLSPNEFSEALREAGLSPAKFRRFTGATYSAVETWLLPEGAGRATEPPFWVTSWLAMYAASGDAQETAKRVAKENLIREGTANG